jgi:hypothetical protein
MARMEIFDNNEVHSQHVQAQNAKIIYTAKMVSLPSNVWIKPYDIVCHANPNKHFN